MAVRYAVASGNWSSGATWNGGTVPTSADDVYANTFTVTIDGTFTVLSVRNTALASPVITVGGQFIYANNGNLTCTATIPFYSGIASLAVIEMTLAAGNTATFNGSSLVSSGTLIATATAGIRSSGTGTLNINGSFTTDYGGGSGSNNKNIIQVTGNGTVNVVGNLINNSANANNNAIITITSTATGAVVNCTGNITSNSTSAGIGASVVAVNAGTFNVTGNLLSSTSPSVFTTGGAVNVIGNVTGGTTQPAIINGTAAASISVTGIVTVGFGAPAIYSNFALTSGYASATYVKISGNVINTLNNMAVVAPRVTIDSNTSSWLFQISTGGDRILYAAGVPLGNPIVGDVRFGTIYGASNELTGTMRVPSAANVLQGVLVDNTVGTLLMTPAQCWNYLISSGFVANSIGDRLQNASTVATTGAQLASYNI
jgi:hypothetical protein